MKKIIGIEAKNKSGKSHTWSSNILFWDELPRWLLKRIKAEMPTYQVKIFYA